MVETNFFGLARMIHEVLPGMRRRRRGNIVNVSSIGGLVGFPGVGYYNATKFAVEGLSESLAKEVAPLGIRVLVVEPGPFRTDFLSTESIRFCAREVPDYDERRTALRSSFEKRNGQQPGDPAKLAEAVVRLANEPGPPMRFVAGSIAFRNPRYGLASSDGKYALP